MSDLSIRDFKLFFHVLFFSIAVFVVWIITLHVNL